MSEEESAPPQLLATLQNITEDTNWCVGDLPELKEIPDQGTMMNSDILRCYTMSSAWIQAKMIKTGFNTRKTTKKGVRRMRVSLKTRGYMHTSAVIVYPGAATATPQPTSDHFALSQSDLDAGIQFMCADGMHRVRCVTELTEEKASGVPNILCGDSVYATILRPDTPRKYLIQLSLSKYIHICIIVYMNESQ